MFQYNIVKEALSCASFQRPPPKVLSQGGKGYVSSPDIRIGVAGWSYPDWKGIVYPRVRAGGFHEAAYLARFFDVLEINTSFYRPVPAAMAAGWVRRVAHNPDFRFTAKLHKCFTHEGSPTGADERAFRQMADALMKQDRLGAVLAQFPWSFRNTGENKAYLGALLERLREYPVVVEVRHSSWKEPGFFDLLRERGAGFCNVDQPVVGQSLPPTSVATSEIGYVRLHGRNYKEWFADSGRDARYNYLYSKAELEAWKPRIEQVAGFAKTTYVIANNHFRGQAAANALQLLSLLRNQPVQAPTSLVEAYPELKECCVTEQRLLFRL